MIIYEIYQQIKNILNWFTHIGFILCILWIHYISYDALKWILFTQWRTIKELCKLSVYIINTNNKYN